MESIYLLERKKTMTVLTVSGYFTHLPFDRTKSYRKAVYTMQGNSEAGCSSVITWPLATIFSSSLQVFLFIFNRKVSWVLCFHFDRLRVETDSPVFLSVASVWAWWVKRLKRHMPMELKKKKFLSSIYTDLRSCWVLLNHSVLSAQAALEFTDIILRVSILPNCF